MMVNVGDDLWVNPEKVEMVFLNKTGPDGKPLDPYVVVGFQGGTGRSLPPGISLEETISALSGSTALPPIINHYQERDNFNPLGLIAVVSFVIAAILFFIAGALFF